jgi:hypothetical protein
MSSAAASDDRGPVLLKYTVPVWKYALYLLAGFALMFGIIFWFEHFRYPSLPHAVFLDICWGAYLPLQQASVTAVELDCYNSGIVLKRRLGKKYDVSWDEIMQLKASRFFLNQAILFKNRRPLFIGLIPNETMQELALLLREKGKAEIV